MFSRRKPRALKKLSESDNKFVDFTKEEDAMFDKKDKSEKRGIAYVLPPCKAHIPKPTEIKSKVLFCSKQMKGLSIPLYSK